MLSQVRLHQLTLMAMHSLLLSSPHAALLNSATIAIFQGSPLGRPFGVFVERANVTMLGLIPSLAKVRAGSLGWCTDTCHGTAVAERAWGGAVQAWRATDCMKGLDWSCLRCFRWHLDAVQNCHSLARLSLSIATHPGMCLLAGVSPCCSSTGEASAPEDYLWLMARAGYKPVIEYCGGGADREKHPPTNTH